MRSLITAKSARTPIGLLVALLVAAGVSQAGAAQAQAQVPVRNHATIAASQTPAFAGDAGDPDVVLANGTYYAFTSGTALGNNIQALVDTSGSPRSGWGSYTGTSFGSTALPSPPAWEEPNTQTSPGVFNYGGHWVMWYDAALAPHPEAAGHSCLSVATAASLTPAPQFTDTSSVGYCPAGGVLDPSPFVDPATGVAYLIWKSNDGASSAPSQVWSVRLTPNGTAFAGTPTVLLTVDQAALPWETTTDDPQMVHAFGTYQLLFSGGNYLSTTYNEAIATCSGPMGPCSQPSGPFLTTYGSVYGPGGGSLFQDTGGNWWLGYAAWNKSCTTYSSPCNAIRQLFVAPVDLSNGLVVPCNPPAGGAVGYRMTASDGGIFDFGNLPFCGSTGGIHINQPIVGMASTSDGGGYWTVARDGGVFAFGDAQFHGSTGNVHLNQPIVGMAATPDGKGYWMVASDGGIFSFGDAQFHGSTGNLHLNRPIVGMATTGDGGGYWLVASDGGIFSFGDARFHGSTGNIHLNQPIVGMTSTPSGDGYWMVASDGGIFSFGNAQFHGSTGSVRLNKPIVGMTSTSSGGGYWMVASDGGIFSFGNAPFHGSTGGIHLNQPIVGMSGP